MRRSSRGSSSIPGWGDDDGDASDLGTGLLQAEVMGPGGGDVVATSGRSVQLISRFGGGGHRYAGLDEDDDGGSGSSRGRSDSFTARSRRLSGNGAAAVVPVARSAADKDRISNEALARQQANNAKFMQQLKSEEDAFLARIKQKKATEDADAAFARQLQQEEEAAASAVMARGGSGGGGGGGGGGGPQQGIGRGVGGGSGGSGSGTANGRTQLVRINLPPQVEPGSVLRISVPGVGLRDVIVPPGAAGGSAVEYHVPVIEKIVVRVTLPADCSPGQVISVRVPGTSENVQVTVPANATPGSTLQFEVSPSRVPEPVQAVGFQNSLGSAAEVYGGGAGAAPAQPARRRRASSGVSYFCFCVFSQSMCTRLTTLFLNNHNQKQNPTSCCCCCCCCCFYPYPLSSPSLAPPPISSSQICLLLSGKRFSPPCPRMCGMSFLLRKPNRCKRTSKHRLPP